MDKPVYDKCVQCVKYNANYVHIKSNEGFTNKTLHGCSSKGCSIGGGFQEFARLPEAATKAALEGSAKTSSHYQVGTKQPIEIMQEVMTPDEFRGFLRGNVIKYSLRLGHKDAAVKEAAKIEQYAKWLRMALEGKTIKPMED